MFITVGPCHENASKPNTHPDAHDSPKTSRDRNTPLKGGSINRVLRRESRTGKHGPTSRRLSLTVKPRLARLPGYFTGTSTGIRTGSGFGNAVVCRM